MHGPKPISFRTDQLPLEATYIWSPSLSIYMQYRQVYDLCCICLGRSLGYGFDTTIICLRQGWPCITTVRISQAKQFSMNGMSKTFVLDGWSDRGEACVNHINLLLFCIQLAPAFRYPWQQALIHRKALIPRLLSWREKNLSLKYLDFLEELEFGNMVHKQQYIWYLYKSCT